MLKKFKKITLFILCFVGSEYAKNLKQSDFNDLRGNFTHDAAILLDVSLSQVVRQAALDRAQTVIDRLRDLSQKDYPMIWFSGFNFNHVSVDTVQSSDQLREKLKELSKELGRYRVTNKPSGEQLETLMGLLSAKTRLLANTAQALGDRELENADLKNRYERERVQNDECKNALHACKEGFSKIEASRRK